MLKKSNLFKGLSKSTFLLAFTSFFADISTEMLYPILPIFLTQILKADVSIVGLIEGVATATQNIVQGFSGSIADKLHKRKTMALLGYSLAALSKPFFGFSAIWQHVLITRFTDRLGTGIRSAPRDGLVAASADEKHKGKAFGLEGIGDNLGAFVGPIIALILLFIFHVNIRQIFYLAFIPGILAVIMVLFVKDSNLIRKSKAKISISINKFSNNYFKYLFVSAIFGIGNSSTSFLILQSKNVGLSFELTILIYAFFNLIAALSSYPAGFLSDRFGRKNILLMGFFIFLITYLGFGLFKNILIIGILFIFYGIFQGVFRAVGKALASDLVPAELRSSGIGWYSTVVGVSSLLASIIAGKLWVMFNPSWAFFYGVLTALLGIISLVFLKFY